MNNPLTKQSGAEELRQYFNAIHALSKQDEKFPVDIDDVWGLVYSERGKAVTTLKKNFIEGEDFISFAQTVKRTTGATVRNVYRLSLPCLEYFIARKIRSVFNVYREVFHKVVEQKEQQLLSPTQALLQTVQLMADLEQRTHEQEKKLEYHSQEIENLKQTVDEFMNESHAQLELFNELPPSDNEVPQVSLRTQCINAVCYYAERIVPQGMRPDYQSAWKFFYKQFKDRYHRQPLEDPNRKLKKIDWLERNGLLPQFYDLVSFYIKPLLRNESNRQ